MLMRIHPTPFRWLPRYATPVEMRQIANLLDLVLVCTTPLSPPDLPSTHLQLWIDGLLACNPPLLDSQYVFWWSGRFLTCQKSQNCRTLRGIHLTHTVWHCATLAIRTHHIDMIVIGTLGRRGADIGGISKSVPQKWYLALDLLLTSQWIQLFNVQLNK